MSDPLRHVAPIRPREALPSIHETFGAVLIGSFIGIMYACYWTFGMQDLLNEHR